METFMGILMAALILAAILGSIALYMLPSIIAYSKHVKRRDAVLLLNLFFGWTFLGWIGTLIWACTDEIVPQENQS